MGKVSHRWLTPTGADAPTVSCNHVTEALGSVGSVRPSKQDMNTLGDQLFESFCSLRGIECKRIPEGQSKTPDYALRVGAHRLLAEVKTLEPNKEELEINVRRDRGEIVVGGGTPGERLRREIRTANAQLKAVASAGRVPTLLAVFNNTGCSIHTDPYSVMTAMQGLDVIDVSVPSDPARSPTFGPTHSGPERAMRRDANTSTSALAVIYDLGSEGIHLTVFHNRHAAVPLSVDVLRIPGVAQFRLPENIANSLEAPWSEA